MFHSKIIEESQMRLFFFTLQQTTDFMVRRFLGFLFFTSISLHAAFSGNINTIALKNGCRVVQKPPTFFTPSAYTAKIDGWSVYGLQDQSETNGWCSGAASKIPYVFVFELSEDYIINKLVLNTFCQKEYKAISAKDIKVEYSTTSAKAGFASASTYLLEENKINVFDITAPVKARWIKLTVLSNFGNPQWTELMEFEAWGDFVNPTVIPQSMVGVWNSNFDWVSFNKTSTGTLYGCYKWASGELYLKNISRKTYSFTWKQKDDGQSGWCVLVMNKEGTRLCGVWGLNSDTTKFGYWEFSKTQSTPYACSNDVVANTDAIAKAAIKKEPLLNVMIEVQDKGTSKAIPGDIELYTTSKFYKVPSGDGMYTADINKVSLIIVKTALPNYYPTTDTFAITPEEQKAFYATRVIQLSKLMAGNTILLHDLLFNRTSSELLSSTIGPLDQLVKVLNQYPNMYIELSGHTDNQGDAKKNQQLSEKRVEAVKEYLVSKGIGEERIKTVGYGQKYPIASNDSEQTRKLNRRVEMRIIKM